MHMKQKPKKNYSLAIFYTRHYMHLNDKCFQYIINLYFIFNFIYSKCFSILDLGLNRLMSEFEH